MDKVFLILILVGVPCREEDVLIRSDGKKMSKYSIENNGNTFSVTISHLTEDDAGKYLCGIDRILKDTFKEVFLTVIKGRTQDPDGDFSQSTIGEAFTTNAAHLAFTTNAAHLAFTTSATYHASTTNASGSTKSVSADMVLFATVGCIATLSVSLLLATRFRKCRDVVSADEGEFDNENDDIAKEMWSMIRFSKKYSGTHHPKLYPSTSVYTEVKYSAPLQISENI